VDPGEVDPIYFDPPKLIDLRAALKRSLAQEAEPEPKKARVQKLFPNDLKRRCSCRCRVVETDVAVAKPVASTASKRRKRAGKADAELY
jgi:hypothetical protein